MKFSKHKTFAPLRLCVSCICFISLLTVFACEKTPPPPAIESIEPTFAPAEELVTIQGVNLANIQEVTFSGQVVNFNTAFNSENALLLRVPTNVPLGDHELALRTKGGTASVPFRVTLEPPEVFKISPESAAIGETIKILGKNFFEPIEVRFFDSVAAEIVTLTPDSLEVIVPEGVEKGRVTVDANGGAALSPIDFFTVNSILVNDFDGNGVRSETIQWIFVGSINENRATAVRNENPEPIDGNFLKISGKDDLGINWIGGAENNSFDVETFPNFGITTSLNNTLLELDIHNNGRKKTNVILVLLERDGSRNDFTHQFKVDWEGWKKYSVPLNRFNDLNGIPIDPAKVRTIKIHLIDADASGETLEVNVDNIRFTEIL
ncbi:MAG: glycan-binding surface protein [Bacteroidota bacterium]